MPAAHRVGRHRGRVPTARRTPVGVGLALVDDGDGTVRVTLDGRTLADDLGELGRDLAGLLPGGTDTLRLHLVGVDRPSSVCVAALLRVKRVCVARRIRLVIEEPPTTHGRTPVFRSGLHDVLEAGDGR